MSCPPATSAGASVRERTATPVKPVGTTAAWAPKLTSRELPTAASTIGEPTRQESKLLFREER